MALRLTTLITISLSGLVIALYMGLFAGSSTPAVSAEEFLFQLPDQLPVSPGQFVHTRTERWERHGPKAAVIEAAGQRPELTIAESWFEIGDGPVVVRALSTLSDSTGAMIQRATLGDSGSRSTDPRTGEVLTDNPDKTTGTLNGSRRRAAVLKSALQSGAKVIRQTTDTLTIEIWDEPLSQGSSDDPGDWTIPYVRDLDPTASVRRLTVDRIGTVTKDEVFVVDRAGSRVLVSQSETVTEILHEKPVGVFEAH